MDIRKVKKLIELLEESGIAEIEIKEGEESVRISRMPTGGMVTHLAPAMMQAPVVAAAAAAWGCIIPARTATTLSIFVAPISINMAGRAVRRCAPWASMRRSKDCYSKR